MNKPEKIRYAVLFSILVLTACNGDIYFREPQPSFEKNLKEIPSVFQGFYYVRNDSSYFRVTSKYIIAYRNKISSTDSTVQAKDMEPYEKKAKLIPCTCDTSYSLANGIIYNCIGDTAFNIDNGTIVRKYGNSLYLNTDFQHYLWKVSRIRQLTENEFEFGTIDQDKELAALKKVTSVQLVTALNLHELAGKDTIMNKKLISLGDSLLSKNDSVYLVNPTKREFRQIDNGPFFTEVEKMVRMRSLPAVTKKRK